MLLYILTFLVHSILVTVLTAEDANRTLAGSVPAKATCPLDPFSNLRAHATPKPSEPICCLIPSSSEDSTSTDEFLSFEEWKSKQRELESHSSQIQSSNQTGQVEPSGPNSPDTKSSPAIPSFGDTETMVDITPTQPLHFRVPLTDRFNYASLDCSARIRSSHSSARSPSSLLSSKKDKYMLSPCSDQPNYVVVELCDDIRIDTVQLANFEYFSGVFRDFKVSVAQTYTSDDQTWVEAGSYRAKNVRGVQSFHPLVDLLPFYRYVRIDFLSHYGNEYYCPVSLLRVYGLTQLEEWKWELWQRPSEPTASHTGSLLNSISTQSAESSNVSTPNTSALSTSDSLDDTIIDEDTLFSATSIESLTDVDTAGKHTQTTPIPNVSMPSTISLVPSSEPLPSPIISSDSSISHALPTTHTMNASISMSTPIGYSIPMSGHGSSGESIFRTIMNRLNMLEANTTLYTKYVEEQTLRLRDALRKLEEDVGRLEGLNKNQQQIFLRTVQEFDRHRQQIETERSALLDRVNQLADEIVLEKRLGIAQLCLLLTILIFMTLTRGSRTNISSLFSGTVHHHRSPWSAVDFTRPRSKTPVSHATQKKGHARSHSNTTASASKSTLRSARKDTHGTSTPHSNLKNVKDERPTYRLHRSNSNVTPVVSPFSGKRLAQTAHLHEISVLRRHELNIPDGSKTPMNVSVEALRPKRNSDDAYGSYFSDFNKQSKTDKTSDSWIDTEPGSGTSDNDQESLP